MMKYFDKTNSQYWSFMQKHQFLSDGIVHEYPEANPDTLAEAFKWIGVSKKELSESDEENFQAYERIKSKGFINTLSKREKTIWKMFESGVRITVIAKVVEINRLNVYTYIKRIGKKIQKQILKEKVTSNEKKAKQK